MNEPNYPTLTEREYKLLERISKRGTILVNELSAEDIVALQRLKGLDYIELNTSPEDGEGHLHNPRKMLHQKPQYKRYRGHNCLSYRNLLLSALAGFILGLLAAYFLKF